MMTLGLLDMQQYLADHPASGRPTFSVVVLRNVMLDSMEPALRYHGQMADLDVRVTFGEFDNIFQEACGCNAGPIREDTDCIVVAMALEGVSWELARNFPSMDASSLEAEIERVSGHVDAILKGIRKRCQGMILWFGFELAVNPALGIFDSQTLDGQNEAVRRLNQSTRQHLAELDNAYFMDMSLCLARVGADNFYDYRYWHVARNPYSKDALLAIAHELFKYIRALKGKTKKCLVLDCDNTLWGGVIGEDGLAGIQLDKSYPGSMFYEFQTEILSLNQRGVILALCSKNNEEDVWQVFDEHPAMVLKREHIASSQINWDNKVENIRRIAEDLNIGLDSLVFCDDSDFEVELVRRELPEVEVIRITKSDRPRLRALLAGCGLFDTLTISAEDRNRGEMYKSEAERKKLHTEATNMEEYLTTLEMEITVSLADEFSIPRIAQQTQKTNQFNLTTKRYSDAEIAQFASSDDSDVLSLRLQDRFGDSGIVGTCILRYLDTTAFIDTLLLSCRVLGRCVEDVFLGAILRRAGQMGASTVVGTYVPTRKNGQVETFYPQHGFQPYTSVSPEEGGVSYSLNISVSAPDFPLFFKKITTTYDELKYGSKGI